MKKLFIALIIFLFSVSFVHAVTTASGSVTLANKRLSMVNGTAFVDFSAAGTLTAYLGQKLTITSSANKKIVGYIKAAGTGETLGDELVKNGGFDSDTTGWNIGSSALLASVSGGESGNCLRVTENGATNPYASQAIPVNNGKLYKILASVKQGTSSTYRIYPAGGAMPTWTADRTSTSSWQIMNTVTYGVTPYTTATKDDSVWIALIATATAGSGLTHLFDNVTFKQVLTPSATGVTITSTPNGTTYNWTSIESGFNYNDINGYTYTIESVGGGAGGFTLLNVQ